MELCRERTGDLDDEARVATPQRSASKSAAFLGNCCLVASTSTALWSVVYHVFLVMPTIPFVVLHDLDANHDSMGKDGMLLAFFFAAARMTARALVSPPSNGITRP
jgi:hypothetical protein